MVLVAVCAMFVSTTIQQLSEFRSCVKVEVAVLGFPS